VLRKKVFPAQHLWNLATEWRKEHGAATSNTNLVFVCFKVKYCSSLSFEKKLRDQVILVGPQLLNFENLSVRIEVGGSKGVRNTSQGQTNIKSV